MLRKRTEELTENGAVFIVETFLNAAGEEKGGRNTRSRAHRRRRRRRR